MENLFLITEKSEKTELKNHDNVAWSNQLEIPVMIAYEIIYINKSKEHSRLSVLVNPNMNHSIKI